MNEDTIKDIITSKPGRRLITCMLLVQPITIAELKQMIKLSLEVFNPRVTMNREFPNVSNIEFEQTIPELVDAFKIRLVDKSHLSKDLFTNADLYDEKRILKKAVESGLVIEKKVNGEGTSYFFLNSDLQFIPDVKKGIRITTCCHSYPYKHTHKRNIKSNEHQYSTESINERTALPIKNPNSVIGVRKYLMINDFLMLFWWLIKHRSLIFKTLEKYKEVTLNDKNPRRFTRKDLPKEWRKASHLIKRALKTNLFVERGDEFDFCPALRALIMGNHFFSFARSYEILRCFDNFEDHLVELQKKTPMQMLDVLTSEQYKIDPAKRPLLFTSIARTIKLNKNNLPRTKLIDPSLYEIISTEEPTVIIGLIGNNLIAPPSLIYSSEIINYCPELENIRQPLLQVFPHKSAY